MTEEYRNPTPTVDVIVVRAAEVGVGLEVLLIERRNPPYGWALPGGFVDEGEFLEGAALRELEEETSLKGELSDLLYVYSDPKRDPRLHTISVVFIVRKWSGVLKAADDAADARFFFVNDLPEMAFDHGTIIGDFCRHEVGERGMQIRRWKAGR